MATHEQWECAMFHPEACLCHKPTPPPSLAEKIERLMRAGFALRMYQSGDRNYVNVAHDKRMIFRQYDGYLLEGAVDKAIEDLDAALAATEGR